MCNVTDDIAWLFTISLLYLCGFMMAFIEHLLLGKTWRKGREDVVSGQRNPSALADYKLRTLFSTFSITTASLSLGLFHLSKRYIWQSPRLSAAYRVTTAYVLVGHFHRCGSDASVFRPLQQKLLDPF